MAYNSAYTGPQIDEAVGAVRQKEKTWDGKQDALAGAPGQVVGFDAEGKPVAQDVPSSLPAGSAAVWIKGYGSEPEDWVMAIDPNGDEYGFEDAVSAIVDAKINDAIAAAY